MDGIGNYARHAAYWDWSGHDRTREHAHWAAYAKSYGKQVLIPFCAWGETGAYLARHGFHVTAFDITPEMIAEGKKRCGDVPGLRLCEGDVTDFAFDIPPVDFCFAVDFGHILSLEGLKKALACINSHMREGGALVIEAGMPARESVYTPPKTFFPLKQVYPCLKVWKTGDGRTEAETGRHYISQTFYAEHENGRVESFDHAFYLQLYAREAWLAALKQCGFEIKGEYRDRRKKAWREGDGLLIIEAVKRSPGAQ